MSSEILWMILSLTSTFLMGLTAGAAIEKESVGWLGVGLCIICNAIIVFCLGGLIL